MDQAKVANHTVTEQSRTAELMQASLAAFLGLGLFMAVAFADSSMIHNAAHDSRHGITVPCH